VSFVPFMVPFFLPPSFCQSQSPHPPSPRSAPPPPPRLCVPFVVPIFLPQIFLPHPTSALRASAPPCDPNPVNPEIPYILSKKPPSSPIRVLRAIRGSPSFCPPFFCQSQSLNVRSSTFQSLPCLAPTPAPSTLPHRHKWARRQRPFGLATRARRVRLRGSSRNNTPPAPGPNSACTSLGNSSCTPNATS
jgi:hypothetical protein